MTITINHDTEPGVENYLLNVNITVDDEATAEDAVFAFIKALSIDGYHNHSIIRALLTGASEFAYRQESEQTLKDGIKSLIEEWEWNKGELINE